MCVLIVITVLIIVFMKLTLYRFLSGQVRKDPVNFQISKIFRSQGCQLKSIKKGKHGERLAPPDKLLFSKAEPDALTGNKANQVLCVMKVFCNVLLILSIRIGFSKDGKYQKGIKILNHDKDS